MPKLQGMGTGDQLKPRAWLMANLVGQLAFGLLAMTICLPSMQDWPATFGASQASVQLTFSGFVAAYGAMQLVYGPWSDRIGRKPVLLAGLAVAFVGSVMAALAQDLGTLVFARVLQGAGSAAGMVTSRALVQDLFVGAERTRIMAVVGMCLGLMPPLATVLGGRVHVGIGWQANFAGLSVLAVLLAVAAWRGLPDRPPREQPATGMVRSLLGGYARLLRDRTFLLYVLMMCSTTATFYSFLAGAPVVLKAYGVTPERVGFYIMCIPMAYIFGNLLTSRLIHRQGERRIMIWGQALTVAGILLMLALGLAGVGSPLALSAPLMLLGVGQGLLVPPTLTGTVGLVPALAGSAAAVGGVAQQMAGAGAGYAVGLVPHDTQVYLALLMLGCTAAGVVAQAVLDSRLPRRQAVRS